MKIDFKSDEQVLSGNNGPFKPLPAGDYRAQIYDVSLQHFKPTSKNPNRPYYKITFKLVDNKRQIFQQVGLFPQWSTGSDNFTFFQFFSVVLGMSEKTLRKAVRDDRGEFEVPDPKTLMGKELILNLDIEDDSYAYAKAVEQERQDAELEDRPEQAIDAEEYKRNTVKRFKPIDDDTVDASTSGTSSLADGGFIDLTL